MNIYDETQNEESSISMLITIQSKKKREKKREQTQKIGWKRNSIQIELTEHAQTLTLILHGLGFPTLYNVLQYSSNSLFVNSYFLFFVFLPLLTRITLSSVQKQPFFIITDHSDQKKVMVPIIFYIYEAKKFQFIFFCSVFE